MELRIGKIIKEPCGWTHVQRKFGNMLSPSPGEAESVGFDELNFDYIRFPSDGNMKDIKYPHCDATLTKPDLLENFSIILKKSLAI